MKNLENIAEFIKIYVGETLGSFIIIVLILLTVYKSVFDSGLFQHLLIVVRFRRWKIDKEIKELTELIEHGGLNESVKLKYIEMRRALYLQRQLLTKEKRLEVLDILSTYKDEKEAVRLYNASKKVISYNPLKNELRFKRGYQITASQTRKHKSRVFLAYWILALPAAVWVMYEHYHLIYKQSTSLGYKINFLFIFGIYVIWIFSVAYVLRCFLRRSNAYKLLNMKKIK